MRVLPFLTLASLLAAVCIFTRSAAATPFDEGNDARLRGDYALALKIWQPLAQAGEADAENGFGVLTALGQGVPADQAAALFWFRKSAAQGFAKAQFNLANDYLRGTGVAPDSNEAFRYASLAAQQGLRDAEYMVGNFYYLGNRGVAVDYLKAGNWFRKAAAQGYPPAPFRLGILYEYGLGLRADNISAYVWFTIAVQGSDNKIADDAYAELKRMTPKMSDDQIAAARQSVTRCHASQFQDCGQVE